MGFVADCLTAKVSMFLSFSCDLEIYCKPSSAVVKKLEIKQSTQLVNGTNANMTEDGIIYCVI